MTEKEFAPNPAEEILEPTPTIEPEDIIPVPEQDPAGNNLDPDPDTTAEDPPILELKEEIIELEMLQPETEAANEEEALAAPEGTEFITEPEIEAVTEPGIEAVTEPGIEAVTEPGIEAVTEPGIEAVTEPEIEAVTDSVIEAVTLPETETEAGTESLTETTEEAIQLDVLPELHDQEPLVLEIEEEHEYEEAASEANEEELNNISALSRQQLVALLEDIVKDPDVSKIKTNVALIKVTYLKLSKADRELHLEKYIKEGEEKPSGQAVEDPLEVRFEAAFETYKLNKAKFLDEQEKLKHKNLEEKQRILEELKELINSEETLKRTYDQFRALQDKWKEIGMVPKTEVNNLWQSYHFLVEKFFDKVKINKELKDLDLKKNLEAKIKLCERAEELLLEISIIKSFKQLQKYHEEWKEIGPVPQDKKDEIWERFKTATDKINDRRRDHYRKLQDEQQQNYTAKVALCDRAEQIVTEKNSSLNEWQHTTDEMTELLKIWKSIGPASKRLNDKIWERFKTSLDAYFSDKKEYFGKVKEQQIHNYNLKLDLCVQAEALKNSNDWRKTTQDLINLQKEWKEIGPVPRKHSNRIWKRFRATCDEFFSSKANYFSNIQKNEAENLRLKQELIKKIQEYQLAGNKNEDLGFIKEMQREWMEIGHVPIKEKDKLQNDFRIAINKHLDKLKVDAIEISTLSYKAHFETVKDSPDANRILSKEKGALINKLNNLIEDISLWENNIGFLADSKNAQILKMEFEKKIEKAKQERVILEAKIRILSGQQTRY
jgi:hypothetical protein